MEVTGGGNIRLSLDAGVLQNHNTVKHFVIFHNRKILPGKNQFTSSVFVVQWTMSFKFSCLLSTETLLTYFLKLLSPLQKLSV